MLRLLILLCIGSSVALEQTCGRPVIAPQLTSSENFTSFLQGNRDFPRIVGGVEADPHSWPWQVYIEQSRTNFSCGGSIVSLFSITFN